VGGANEWFYIDSTTHANFGFAEGKGNGVFGQDPDYRITAAFADLENESGTAVHASCPTYTSGHFDESALINLTAEARVVLARRGARFG
jgi:hypothetical protein